MQAEVEVTRFGDVDKVSEITGLSKSTLIRYRLYQPEMSPPFARVGRRIVYPLTGPNSVSTWIEQRIQNIGGRA